MQLRVPGRPAIPVIRRAALLVGLPAVVLLLAVAGVVLVRGSGGAVASGGVASSGASPPPASSAAPPDTPGAPSDTAGAAAAPSRAPTPTFDVRAYSIDDPASPWVVVDKARPLVPLDHAPADLVPVGNGETMSAPAAQALGELIAAAATQGLDVRPLSGYRSYDYQVGVHASAVSRLGQAAADAASARAGYSEHQTGLAVDVGGGGCDIEQCFGTTPEGSWVAAECWRYGFLVRYTTAEQQVTGFKGEPWHLRYVGVGLATEMHDAGIATLEQFFGLPAAPDYLD